jgi:isocitrate dehydrogenase kinase/phosphatase
MEYNKHVLNSNNVIRTTWKLINKELGMGNKNHGIQSINIGGRSAANQLIIADAFNKHFKTIPSMINRNSTASYCLTKTSANNQNTLSCSLKHAFQNSIPSIKYNCTTTKEIENIIMSFKSSNYFSYDEVPTEILNLCSQFFIAPS